MKLTRDEPKFRPVNIRIETQDEFDQLFYIISDVAENRVNHVPQVINAAVNIRDTLVRLLDEES